MAGYNEAIIGVDKRENFFCVYGVAEKLLSAQQDLRVLHGDMHHENVKRSGRRGWLAIDPKGLYGERTDDAANVLCNPTGMDDFVANELSSRTAAPKPKPGSVGN